MGNRHFQMGQNVWWTPEQGTFIQDGVAKYKRVVALRDLEVLELFWSQFYQQWFERWPAPDRMEGDTKPDPEYQAWFEGKRKSVSIPSWLPPPSLMARQRLKTLLGWGRIGVVIR
jgi:hypothetical protein